MIKEYDVTSLPLWAQKRLEFSDARAQSLQAELVRRDANVPTNIVVNRFSNIPIYLEDTEEVAFMFDNEEHLEFRFKRNDKGKRIGVYVMASQYRTELAVYPQASNTLALILVPR